MAIETGLEGKPWYVGALVGLLAGAAIYIGVHFLMLKPMKADLARKDAKLAELQTKIQEGRAARAKLPQFREEVAQLEMELDKLLRILPSRRNTGELLRRIREIAEQGDFNLISFTPGGYADRDFYSEWPIKIRLQGTYHNLAIFFDRVSRLPRIVNIQDLKIGTIRRAQQTDHTIDASFTARTFVYKESPPPQEAAAGASP
jgi:type IV pilus assembly protein PilO